MILKHLYGLLSRHENILGLGPVYIEVGDPGQLCEVTRLSRVTRLSI